jgi:hypothetical protein
MAVLPSLSLLKNFTFEVERRIEEGENCSLHDE